MDGDVGRRNAESFGDELAAAFGSLAGRPEFELAVMEMGEAVLRLQRSVGDERVGVGSLDDLCGGA